MRVSSRRVAAGVVLLLLAVLAWRTIFDFDFGTHMATGRWILSNARWPEKDPFTYTVSHREFLAYSWLFQVGLYEIYRAFGVHGLTLARWVILMGTGLLLLDILRVRRCSALAGSLVGVAAILMSEVRFTIRPELVSDFLAASTLWVLERRRQGRAAPLWLLPIIQLIWVNTHLYVFGWGILGAYAVEEVFRRRSLRTPLVPYGILSFLVLFLNPYHYRGVLYPFRLAAMMREKSAYASFVRELASPLTLKPDAQLGLHLYAIWLLLLLGAVALAVHVWKRRWTDVALVGVFGVLAAVSVRNVTIYAVATVPSLCTALDDLVGSWAGRDRGGEKGRVRAALGGGLLTATLGFAALTAVRVVSGGFYADYGRPTRFASAIDRASFALDAAEWLADHDIKGNGFNNFNIGGTLLWRDPAHKVFIDGRGDVAGEKFMRRYLAANNPARWERTQREYGLEYVVFAHRDEYLLLVRKLWRDPGWKVVYVDGSVVIFVRADGPNGHLPEVRLPPPVTDAMRWRVLSSIRVDGSPAARLRRWVWSSESPPGEDALLGVFLLRMNFRGSAERLLLRAALANPTSIPVQANLSALYYAAGLWKEALVTLGNVRALDPDHAILALFDEVSSNSRSPQPALAAPRSGAP